MRHLKIGLFALVALSGSLSLASTPVTVAWAKAILAGQQSESIDVDANGNVYILSNGNIGLTSTSLVQKFTTYGAPLWTQSNFFYNSSIARTMRCVPGGVIVCGDAVTAPPADNDGLIYKLDAQGNLVWLNHINGPDGAYDGCWDFGQDNQGATYALAYETISGNRTVVGNTISPTGVLGASQAGTQMTNFSEDVVGPGPVFAVTGDAAAGGMFAELLAGGGYAFGEVTPTTNVNNVKTVYRYKAAFDPAGLLYVVRAKSIFSAGGQTDTFTIRAFDSNGNVVWASSPINGYLQEITVPKADTIYFTSYSAGAINLYSLSQAQFNWAVQLPASGHLVADDTGGVFIVGLDTDVNNVGTVKTTKYDVAGTVQWSQSYTPPSNTGVIRYYSKVVNGALHNYGSYNTAGGRGLFVAKLIPGVALSSVNLSSATVTGAKSVGGTVKLNAPAPVGGFKVFLSSSDPAAAGVPATVTVPQGANSVPFTCACANLDAKQPVNITAHAAGCARSFTITLSPYALSAISVNSPSVKGGTSMLGSVTLSGPAAGVGRTVTVSSNKPLYATVPASVYLGPTKTTAALTVTTKPVVASQVVTLSASSLGVTKTTTLTVTP
jgi:hypothetical protein